MNGTVHFLKHMPFFSTSKKACKERVLLELARKEKSIGVFRRGGEF